jgi:hypothetical protein
MVPTNLGVLDAFAQVQEWLGRADHAASDIAQAIDRFPLNGELHLHLLLEGPLTNLLFLC